MVSLQKSPLLFARPSLLTTEAARHVRLAAAVPPDPLVLAKSAAVPPDPLVLAKSAAVPPDPLVLAKSATVPPDPLEGPLLQSPQLMASSLQSPQPVASSLLARVIQPIPQPNPIPQPIPQPNPQPNPQPIPQPASLLARSEATCPSHAMSSQFKSAPFKSTISDACSRQTEELSRPPAWPAWPDGDGEPHVGPKSASKMNEGASKVIEWVETGHMPELWPEVDPRPHVLAEWGYSYPPPAAKAAIEEQRVSSPPPSSDLHQTFIGPHSSSPPDEGLMQSDEVFSPHPSSDDPKGVSPMSSVRRARRARRSVGGGAQAGGLYAHLARKPIEYTPLLRPAPLIPRDEMSLDSMAGGALLQVAASQAASRLAAALAGLNEAAQAERVLPQRDAQPHLQNNARAPTRPHSALQRPPWPNWQRAVSEAAADGR